MPDINRSKKRKWIIIAIAIVFVIATIILSLNQDDKDAVSVEAEVVKYNTVIQKVNASGTIQPETEVKISSSTSSAWIESVSYTHLTLPTKA